MGPRGVSVLAGCMPVVGAGDRQVKSNSGACSGALQMALPEAGTGNRGPMGRGSALHPFARSVCRFMHWSCGPYQAH
jgi:hypothetical protein